MVLLTQVWFFFTFCVMVFCTSPCRGEDALAQEKFERALLFLFKDDLGYTLIGEKPVSISWCESFELTHDREFVNRVCDYLRRTFVNSDRFFLNVVSINPRLIEIQLIHKGALSTLLAKNKALRRFVEHTYGSEENLFSDLKNSSNSLLECFHGDSRVLGRLFGYGKDNTEFHWRYHAVGLYLRKYPRVRLFSFSCRPNFISVNANRVRPIRFRLDSVPPRLLQPLPNFTSLEEEWTWIYRVLRSRKPEIMSQPPYLFYMPYYLEGVGQDSDEVRRHFIRARHKLAKLFLGQKPSEVIAKEAARSITLV